MQFKTCVLFIVIVFAYISPVSAAVTPPTYITEAETLWSNTTTPKVTANFSVQTGDILVAYGIAEGYYVTNITPSGGGYTWNHLQSAFVNFCAPVYVYYTTATSAQSMSVTFTKSGGTYVWGGNVLVFRGSTGIGNSTKTNLGSGAPTLGITTTQTNSSIVVAVGDYNAVDGASRVWRTGAGALQETSYYSNPGVTYTTYGGYHNDSGAIGVKTVGLTAPTGQAYSIVAVEVKGAEASAEYIPPVPVISTVTNGTFWVNQSWTAGSGNVTNSYNVSVNGIWNNTSSVPWRNTSVGAGNWSNITVYAYNSSGTGTLSTTALTNNTQAPLAIPPTPINLANTTGNFWVNHTWQAGSGNITNSYNVSQNGTWNNTSSITYKNVSVGAHNWSNISVYAYNSSGAGSLNATPISMNTQVPNNAISISNVSSSYSITEGQILYIAANYADSDGDTGAFADNATQWDVNSGTGIVSWQTVDGDQGVYNWQINVTDGYGSVSTSAFSVTVGDSTPSVISSLANTTGNFWINWTWNAGTNDDDYDVWINNSDLGADTSSLYYNSTYSAHASRIISVRGHNHTLNTYSGWVNQTTNISDNPITITNTSNKTVSETETVYVDYDYSDIDSDSGIFSCNRTDLFTDFSTSSGTGNWTTNSSSAGTYYVDFGVIDGYGSSSNYTMQIIVNESIPDQGNISWWNSSWTYRADYVFTGSVPYQLSLNISNSIGTNNNTTLFCNGHCNPNFSDIRILSNNTTTLPYWFQNYTTGLMWVNVTLNNTVNIYYGNPDATISTENGYNTFEHFDDFNDNTSNQTITVSTGLEPWNDYPAIITTQNGSYITAWNAGTSENSNDGKIRISQSYNSGLSWTTPTVVNDSVGIADTTPFFLQNGNKTMLFWNKWYNVSYTRIMEINSTDNGVTWSSPRWIDLGIAYNIPMSNGIVLSTGRLIIPWGYMLGSTTYNAAAYSDDNGSTWQLGNAVPNSTGEQIDEPSITELSNGSLLMSIRSNIIGNWRYSISTDGGETWGLSYITPVISSYSSPAPIYTINGIIYLAANPSIPRNTLNLFASCDNAQSWHFLDTLTRSYGEYPSIAYKDNTITIVYGTLDTIISRSYNLTGITNNCSRPNWNQSILSGNVTWIRENGLLKQVNTSNKAYNYLYFNTSLTNYIVHVKLNNPYNFSVYQREGVATEKDAGMAASWHVGSLMWNNKSRSVIIVDDVSYNGEGTLGYTAQINTWYEYDMLRQANTQKLSIRNVSDPIIWTSQTSLTSRANTIAGINGGMSAAVWFDDFFVRRYADPEPRWISAGTESTLPSSFANVSVYANKWQPILVNNSMTMAQYGSTTEAFAVSAWNVSTLRWDTHIVGRQSKASWPLIKGQGIEGWFLTNKTVNFSLNTSYSWNLTTGWDLVGFEQSVALSAINTSVNSDENCAVDYIVYTNLSTSTEYTFTCGQSGNASITVNAGEAVWMYANSNISKVREW